MGVGAIKGSAGAVQGLVVVGTGTVQGPTVVGAEAMHSLAVMRVVQGSVSLGMEEVQCLVAGEKGLVGTAGVRGLAAVSQAHC